MNQRINRAFLSDILSPLTGGADMDSLTYLSDLDSNDEAAMKNLISEFFYPLFVENGLKYQNELKEVLKYYLTTRKISFGELLDSSVLPFDLPDNPIDFYIWMWELFWPNENFFLSDTNNYKEIEDIYEPQRYRIGRQKN